MSTIEPIDDLTAGQPPVRGYLHTADSANVLVLTHGAGGNCNAPLLMKLATAFANAGLNVLRCDLPFRQRRPHGPPIRTASEDQAGLRRAADLMRARFAGHVWMGGHSYGGRMASMLLSAETNVAERLLLLSYPLHPPNKPEQKRTAHLPALHKPTLFVHGTKDPFGTIEEIEAARQLVPDRTELLVIQGGTHSPPTKAPVIEQIVERFLALGQ